MITASTLVLRSSVMQTEIKTKLMNEWIEISRIIAQHNRPYHSNEICFALLIYTCVCVYDKYIQAFASVHMNIKHTQNPFTLSHIQSFGILILFVCLIKS